MHILALITIFKMVVQKIKSTPVLSCTHVRIYISWYLTMLEFSLIHHVT